MPPPDVPGVPGFPLPADAAAPKRAANAPAPGTVLPHHYAQCYACGEAQEAGLHLVPTAGEGVTLTGQLLVTQAHQGAPGLAHGGLIATVFDETLGFLLWLLALPAVTAKLETQYRAPVPIGRRLHIAAQCTGVAGRKVYTYGQGRLDGPEGPVVAEASGLFVVVPLEHFTRYAPVEALGRMSRLADKSHAGQLGDQRPEYNP